MEMLVNDPLKSKLCLSLGFFDCMHIGHREILSLAGEYAKKNGLKNAVFTFDTERTPLVKGDDKQVYTYGERLKLFTGCGVECIIAYPFDERVKNTAPQDFLDGLTAKYDISAFVCGEDYTFGKGGKGNVESLKRYCDERGLELLVCSEKRVLDEKVSTTVVKRLLQGGEIEKANELLKIPYFICGPVVKGRGEGHLFGIPTANVWTPNNKLLPKKGVYGCRITVDGVTYKAVTNVGEKPTFGDYTTTIEALIDGFDGNVYGKEVTLEFVRWLRETRAFSSPEKLAETIRNDLKWE